MSMKVKVNILTRRMIFYIKVFFRVIEIDLACVMHLNIAGNTWLKLVLIVHNINCSFLIKIGSD